MNFFLKQQPFVNGILYVTRKKDGYKGIVLLELQDNSFSRL